MNPDVESIGASSLPSQSPSPNLLPTPVSLSFPSHRSCSGVSSVSNQSSSSNGSSSSRATSSSTSSRRRGYVRPQGGTFAESAKNRESVMSLGSIAHLQYYFARTGLLDGKGGQMAKKKDNGEYDLPKLGTGGVVDSPIDEEGQLLWEAAQEDGEEVMLPPTVSTYSHRSHYVPPPPDQKTLKRELVEALENALHAVEACERMAKDATETPTPGFHELQGLQVLDTTTLAIRAARLYYTLHPNPDRLNAVRSDQELRKELYSVLDVLKKCAARHFAGGFREDERLAVLVWVSEVGMMIDQEAKLEEADRKERKDWHWMDDAKWIDKEQERDRNFLTFLLHGSCPPPGGEDDADDAVFFRKFADGKDLIHMHNAAVKKSKRQFGGIESFHEDVAKPYRRADNLRYWLKAAELRFELKLQLNVMAVANVQEDDHVWASFETAVRQWSQVVRAELTKDWNGEEDRKLHARARSLALATPSGSPVRISLAESPRKKDRITAAVAAGPFGSPTKKISLGSPVSPSRRSTLAVCDEES